jgi:hypothetical protein
MSALDTVAYPMRRAGIGAAEARRQAQLLLEQQRIGHLAARRPAQLSGGEQQRVGLARALDINRNELDNREINLRPCDSLTNSHNSEIHKNNVSGVSGVNYRKDNQKWCARIGNKNERKYLGQFDTFDEAVLARYKAEIEYGYINPNNFLSEGENI